MRKFSIEPPEFHALWDFQNPVLSERRFWEFLSEGTQSWSEESHVLTQIGRAQTMQGRFAAAHETLDMARNVIETERDPAFTRYLLERGRTFFASGMNPLARRFLLRAIEAANDSGTDIESIDAMQLMASIEPRILSLEWSLDAVEVANRSQHPDADHWRAALYGNVGWAYQESRQFDLAVEAFGRAFEIRRALGEPEATRMAIWNIGRAVRAQGRVRLAYTMQKGLLDEYEEAGHKNGLVYEEVAECLWEIGNREAAEFYFAKAYKELSQKSWLVTAEPERIHRLRRLGTALDGHWAE